MHLTEMRTRVRRDLRDTDPTDERWSDDELDRHIERAVRELSLAAPVEVVATLTTSAGSRDLDVSALADRVSIDAVEYPAGQYPPTPRRSPRRSRRSSRRAQAATPRWSGPRSRRTA